MPNYVVLVQWTEQGRKDVASVPDRNEAVRQEVEKLGVNVVASLVTMGRYDQIIVAEAPDDETMARAAIMANGRGNVVTETLRGFTMDEVRSLS